MLGMRLPQLLLGPLRRYPVGIAWRNGVSVWQLPVGTTLAISTISMPASGWSSTTVAVVAVVAVVVITAGVHCPVRRYPVVDRPDVSHYALAIANWNGIHNINLIYAGQRLYIP